MNKLQELMDDIREWSVATFGASQQTTIPILFHLKKEVDELILEAQYGISEEDYEEFADCFMLLLDASKGVGLSADRLIEETYKKLEKNKKRKWGTPDENGVIEHIRE